jgi:hypothetical protein
MRNRHIDGLIGCAELLLIASSFPWRIARRRLATLVIVLMTLALVTRALAAPVIHLHDAMVPALPAAIAAAQSEKDDCVHDADSAMSAASMTHSADHSHAPDSPITTHGKACDTNGACCGPLALNETALVGGAASPTPEPARLLMSDGIAPESPHRPPSPLLA